MIDRSLQVQLVWRCVGTWWQAATRNVPIQLGRVTAAVVAISAGCLVTPVAQGAPRGQGTFDQQSQNEAINTIPFDRLNDETQAKLWNVVSQPSIYRQLPVTVTRSDPEMHVFLVRYPEVIVSMWQLMGVTKVQIERTGNYTFKASDGAGTVCEVQLVYGDQNTHVYYAEGSYEGALLRKLIRGSCVLVLKSDFSRTEDQQVFVTNRLDMFVQFDNVGAEILAKTLHPLVGKSADHNFTESTRFLSQVSQAAETRSAGLQHLASRLNNVAEPVRDRFVQLTTEVNHRASLREAGGQEMPDPRIASPVTTVPVASGALREARPLYESTVNRKPMRLRR